MLHTASPRTEIVKVSPQIAALWLQNNHGNRHIRKSHVAALAADMKNGRWHTSPDAIAFDTTGRLINGQHRLTAIVESGTSADMIVMWGATAGTYAITDDGQKRTFADHLRHLGHTDTTHLAAVVHAVLCWELNGWPSHITNENRKPTKQELINRLAADEPRFLHAKDSGRRISHHVGLPGSWWGASFFFWSQKNVADATEFEHALCFSTTTAGHEVQRIMPSEVLRESIRRDLLKNRPAMPGNRKLSLAIITKAWNAYRDGFCPQKLSFRVGGANPETFPDIH